MFATCFTLFVRGTHAVICRMPFGLAFRTPRYLLAKVVNRSHVWQQHSFNDEHRAQRVYNFLKAVPLKQGPNERSWIVKFIHAVLKASSWNIFNAVCSFVFLFFSNHRVQVAATRLICLYWETREDTFCIMTSVVPELVRYCWLATSISSVGSRSREEEKKSWTCESRRRVVNL